MKKASVLFGLCEIVKTHMVGLTFVVISGGLCAAEEISLDRQIDCLGEYVRLSSMIQYLRNSGSEIPYADLEESERLGQSMGLKFGENIGGLPEEEIQQWISKAQATLQIKSQGLVTMVKQLGPDEALRITRERVSECKSLVE